MKSLFFIPIYNQIEEFPKLLEELKAAELPCDELLLVNNGCTDGTEEYIHNSGFKYVDFEKNGGVGHAIVAAAEYCIEHGFDILGGLAGNGKMLPSEMSRVLDPIINDEADYVTGSRFLEGGDSPNLPSFRRNSIPMVNRFIKLLYWVNISDSTCGYRAYKLDVLTKANFDWRATWLRTYGLEYYLYAKVILSKKFRYLEVPITMRYPQKGKRYTKIKPFTGWWAMIKPWIVARVDRKGYALE